jgi:5-methylcytosine-specific restriction endonuclease McrA
MSYDRDTLRRIFDRTNGRCHICGIGVCFSNYGVLGARGAWEVEHSNPQAFGGTYHLNNLYPAHVACNREKGTYTTRTARSWHDRQRAPLSAVRKSDMRARNSAVGAGVGLLCFLGGPVAGLLGILAGAVVGGAWRVE